MTLDDKRITMSLDEIIRMEDTKNEDGLTALEEPDIENCNGLHVTDIPRSVTITNDHLNQSPKHTFNNRKNGFRGYNNGRYRGGSFQHYNGGRFNGSYAQDHDFHYNSWKYNSPEKNSRYRPYNRWQNQRQSYYRRNSFYRYPSHRSQENLQYPQDSLTEAALIEFNRNFVNNNRNRRSGSVYSNRSGRSFRSSFSNRSHYSQRSRQSERSNRSHFSNRSFGSVRSFGSNKSFWSNKSFGSNWSLRSNRSFNNYGSNRSFGFKQGFRPYRSGRPWVNRQFIPYRKHKNTLNRAIQDNIKKIQETRSTSSNSVLHIQDLDFTPQPSTTGIPLHQRFI